MLITNVQSKGYEILKLLVAISFIALATKIEIPLKPVHISLTSAAVLVIALSFNRKEAMQAIMGYMLLGVAGLPIFSHSKSGAAVLLGPTGGYLIGMVVCVYVITMLREKFGDESLKQNLFYSFVGTTLLYVFGLTQLSYFVGFDKALHLGLFPFILPGMIKALFVTFTVKYLKK